MARIVGPRSLQYQCVRKLLLEREYITYLSPEIKNQIIFTKNFSANNLNQEKEYLLNAFRVLLVTASDYKNFGIGSIGLRFHICELEIYVKLIGCP